MEQKKVSYKRLYESDEERNFIISESLSVRHGMVCYVYNSSVLKQLQARLDEFGTEYTTNKVDDYWVITPKHLREGQRGKNGKNKNKEEY